MTWGTDSSLLLCQFLRTKYAHVRFASSSSIHPYDVNMVVSLCRLIRIYNLFINQFYPFHLSDNACMRIESGVKQTYGVWFGSEMVMDHWSDNPSSLLQQICGLIFLHVAVWEMMSCHQ